MYSKNWRLICKNQTPKLLSLIKTCRQRLYKEIPKVYKRLLKYDVPISGTLTQYFVTVFAKNWSLENASRIFDLFLFENDKWLTRIVIKLFSFFKSKILSLGEDELPMFWNHKIIEEYLKEKSIQSLIES